MGPAFGLWLFAVSLGASALGGMLGMASGIFIVPILTLFVHLDIRTAIGASLVSVIACSCGSAPPLLKGGLVNIRLAVVLETATTLGALTGVLLAGVIPAASCWPWASPQSSACRRCGYRGIISAWRRSRSPN